jgi:hypothetical protein
MRAIVVRRFLINAGMDVWCKSISKWDSIFFVSLFSEESHFVEKLIFIELS